MHIFSQYLESTVKSLELFEVYINSNIQRQKDIFDSVQKIFDGKISVEELLDKYDITLDKSLKNLQKQYIKKRG